MLTTIKPNQRPQSIQSGEFLVQKVKWYIQVVKEGLDCNFKNTKINSMPKVFEFYSSKYGALASQIVSIQSEKD
jgi:hypothetical protein